MQCPICHKRSMYVVEHEDIELDVCARSAGLIIGRTNLPVVNQGDALFHVAAFRSVGRAEDAVEEFATIHDPALRRTVESNLLET